MTYGIWVSEKGAPVHPVAGVANGKWVKNNDGTIMAFDTEAEAKAFARIEGLLVGREGFDCKARVL
jgi:hypothetical protein